jgi:hypothetical protein
MKLLVTSYSFTASTGVIVFNDYASIVQDGILVITNVTDNIIIYNFADTTRGGVVSRNQINLNYDTSGMSDTDSLQIWYEDGVAPSSNKDDEKLDLVLRTLLQKSADNPVWYDVATNALRTIVSGNVSVVGTLTGVTTVTTVTTVTGLTNIGGNPADQATINWMETDWGVTTRNLLI